MGAAITRLLEPADWLRWRLLKALGPGIHPLLRDRALRVAWIGVVMMSLSLVGTLLAPLWMLALGPILLGVPHVLADVRYLVVRPRLHQQPGFWLLIGAPLLAVALSGELAVGFMAAGGAALIASGAGWRRALALAAVALICVGALQAGPIAALIFVHAHNVIAVLLWWAWRPREARHLAPLLAFVGGSLLLLLAPLEWVGGGLAWDLSTLGVSGLGVEQHLRSLAPGLSPELGLRLVLWFAFAQSVHYAIWLRLVPEDDRPRETPRTFAGSLRALRAEFGDLALIATASVAAAIVLWAVVDLAAARYGYLRLASFHGHLELAAAVLLFVQGRFIEQH